MKTRLGIFILCIVSCSQKPETYIEHLQGYWEIQKVTLANGAVKAYQINETIDYIRLNDSLKGFRKKLKPGLNGTYYTSDDAEAVQVKVENDSLRIYYSTPYSTWKETVLKANELQLQVINENKAVYLYKRYSPLELDTN
jgi:hypothetical protein